MAWQFSVYLVPNFLAGAVAALLAAYAWRKRDQRAALPLALMMAGLAVWSVCYGIELGFSTIEPMLGWDAVAFVGSVVVPTAWLLLAVDYAGYEEWITPRTVALLAVEPALTLALVWTNDVHGLIWRSASVDATAPIAVPALVFGPAYWVNLAYSYLLVAAGILLIASVALRASRIHRRRSFVLLAGVVAPLGANVLFNVFPAANPIPNLDLTPFAFAATGGLYALALFRFRMLELAPTARETLVEAMDDGVVVVDADGRVVDLNPAAREALGEDAIGRPLEETAVGDAEVRGRSLLELPVDDESRTYVVSSTTLTDFRGDAVGRFVHLRDITQLQVLRDHEQRLSVLNRLLRHNLRNELNVIAGESEVLAESLEGADRDRLGKIHAAADRMLDIGEKARHVETTIDPGPSEVVPVDVAGIVRDVAGRLDDAYPEATIEVDAPAEARGAAVGSEQLTVAVENLGENAIEHNPAPAPSVRFAVECTDRSVRVSVADDGPEIPEMERAAIARDRETPLLHGSGVGLWLVRWIVDASAGDLAFEARTPEGNVVTIDLPREPVADGPRRGTRESKRGTPGSTRTGREPTRRARGPTGVDEGDLRENDGEHRGNGRSDEAETPGDPADDQSRSR